METDPKYLWVDRLKADPVWGKYRFKRLDKGHFINPNVDIHHELIDVVNFTVFVRIEEDRLPLFIGPLYNLVINLSSVYLDYPQHRTIAILEESLLFENFRGLTIKKYFRGEKEQIAFFRNEELAHDKLITTDSVIKQVLKIRSVLKEEMDSDENPIDMELDPIPPYKGSEKIKLIIIGQDPTIKNKNQRAKIKTTLNLDKNGSLKRYIKGICDSLGIGLENVYATNIFKYFYMKPPACSIDFLFEHLTMNIKLLRNELEVYPGLPVITLGEPVLQLLSTDNYDKVRRYWDYKKGVSGYAFKMCTDNDLDRPFYPFPHQPSAGKRFYKETIIEYLNFVNNDI